MVLEYALKHAQHIVFVLRYHGSSTVLLPPFSQALCHQVSRLLPDVSEAWELTVPPIIGLRTLTVNS